MHRIRKRRSALGRLRAEEEEEKVSKMNERQRQFFSLDIGWKDMSQKKDSVGVGLIANNSIKP
jgi:hypothetical protein